MNTTPSKPIPPWTGFHHIALVTPDLEATIHFYEDALGMQTGDILHTAAGKHCFIRPGQSEAWGLHFFEKPEAQIFTDPDLLVGFVLLPGALQHIAFYLPEEVAALDLHERLQSLHVKVTGINEIGAIKNLLFFDNNGILLEATWNR